MIDLHSHTTASDGQHSPTELIRLAAAAGVTQLAVTDHDTVGGLAEATQAAQALGLRVIPGIELSAFVNRREVHILGHFLDPSDEELSGFSRKLRGERETRMIQMVAKMVSLGYPVTMEMVRQIAGDDANLGRPHLARVLMEMGWVRDTKEAFDRFLADGKPGCVERFKISGEEAIGLIQRAGGAATVAHPGVSKIERFELEALKKSGLSGVEVLHSDHNPSVREKYLKIASELDLVATAGSDFHGDKIAPGRLLGTASMPPENLSALRARARAY
ncbi:MAG: PHP domain-containing protein [Myxococcaceae bacterium]